MKKTLIRQGPRGRKRPYTTIGIARVKCIRPGCSRPSHASWAACADRNKQRAMCKIDDVAVNVIHLAFFQPHGWRASVKRYMQSRGVTNAEVIQAIASSGLVSVIDTHALGLS